MPTKAKRIIGSGILNNIENNEFAIEIDLDDIPEDKIYIDSNGKRHIAFKTSKVLSSVKSIYNYPDLYCYVWIPLNNKTKDE